MAWNIVIAGGGFGGLAAARELEKVMPKQSARLMLINETNYATYSPFLPEAAAGTLEPRHVVTPLREILKRTYLRLGRDRRPRPRGEDDRAARQQRRQRDDPLRPAAALARLGLADAADPRPDRARDGLQGPRRRDRPAQPGDREPRGSERDRRSPAARGTAHLRLRRRRLRRPRGAGRAPGLRRRRDGQLPARPPARDALDAGRGGATGAAGDRPGPRRLRPARAARPRHRHQAGDAAERGHRELDHALDRGDRADAKPSSGPRASPRRRSSKT